MSLFTEVMTPRGWILLGIGAVNCTIAYFWVHIEPEVSYGFFAAMIHGWLAPLNWILSWFDGRLFIQSATQSAAYIVGYAFGAVLIPGTWTGLLRIIVHVLRGYF